MSISGVMQSSLFHNIRSAHAMCSSKAKMSALSKVQMSASGPFGGFGGCHFDERGVDEQARTEPPGRPGTARWRPPERCRCGRTNEHNAAANVSTVESVSRRGG